MYPPICTNYPATPLEKGKLTQPPNSKDPKTVTVTLTEHEVPKMKTTSDKFTYLNQTLETEPVPQQNLQPM